MMVPVSRWIVKSRAHRETSPLLGVGRDAVSTPEDGERKSGSRTLADRLNYLFTVVRPTSEDREYTGREVVAGMCEAGTDISPSHLSELRRGIKTNPTLRVLQGLAAFFQVRVAYLLGDEQVEEEVMAELELRKAMSDAQVRDVALRVAGLDPSQRSAMYRMLADVVRENNEGSSGGIQPPPAAS